ncbi:DUF418 domain-containing protein [Lysobacter sp. Root604]|uniref:DUF418 domain-containing protein n=1 Tax=Lysobacter sp. Root604 TaxID=1736568 RepID=UPI0006F73CCB|nr:DUF418 domain-containing protein [Lysobacter sp. Root604]KRA19960.1 hypothetical protein ASD69_00955 [Lysobacter sp. Root604]
MNSQAPAALGPLASSQRILSLDALRGIALLGVLLMNVESFTGSLFDVGTGIAPAQAWPDRLADGFVYIFVQGKFWTLFALLFGMGFASMSERARAAGVDFLPLYLRRSVGLLAIGLIHALAIWSGDILVSYALAAFALLLLRNAPQGALWPIGALLNLMLVAMLLLSSLAIALVGQDAADLGDFAVDQALRAREIAAYAQGSYVQASALRWDYFVAATLPSYWMFVPMALGLFAIGAWFVRSGAIVAPARYPRFYAALRWGAGPLGLAITLIGLAVDSEPVLTGRTLSASDMFATTLQMLAAPLMSLAYLAWIVRALERGARWPLAFAPAGRMALTLYLMQSVIGTVVFYGYGLGLWGEASRVAQVLGACVLFGLQLAFARLWFARLRYGPMEWLWRWFTYARRPALRQPVLPALP